MHSDDAKSLLEGIHLTRWGSEGSRVVMVHGGAQGTSSAGHLNFRAQEEIGQQGWQIIAPDRPGHGQSPNPGRPDSAEEDGRWVAELLGSGAHLVGHSFGGLVALAASEIRPEAVKSLVLIEPALHKVATEAPAVRKFLFGMATSMLLPFSDEARARRVFRLLHIPGEFALDKNDFANLGKALKRAKLPGRRVMEGWLAGIKSNKIPFLILSGSSNPAFIATGEIAAGIGGGRHVVVPSENHFPQWAGAPFNDVLIQFWREADASDH